MNTLKCEILGVVLEGLVWKERCDMCGMVYDADELETDTTTGRSYVILYFKTPRLADVSDCHGV